MASEVDKKLVINFSGSNTELTVIKDNLKFKILPHLPALGSDAAPLPACLDMDRTKGALGLGPTRQGSPGKRIG